MSPLCIKFIRHAYFASNERQCGVSIEDTQTMNILRLMGIVCRYMHFDTYLEHFPQLNPAFNFIHSSIVTNQAKRYWNFKEVKRFAHVIVPR